MMKPISTWRKQCGLGVALALVGLAACSEEESDSLVVRGFAADGQASGGRIWIDAVGDADVAVVTVWAAELGSVFGYSAHVGFDPEILRVDLNDVPIVDERALGGDVPGNAVHLYAIREAHVGIGGARASPELEEISIDDPTRLFVMRLYGLRAGETRLDLSRIIVRRRDGTYSPVTGSGGVLSLSGGES